MPKARSQRKKSVEQQLREIQKEIGALGYVCSGSVSHQRRQCGKPTCACKTDPSARHGPYYIWSRRENNRQVNSMLPNEVGPLFEEAVQNYRKLREILRRWEKASAQAITDTAPAKTHKGSRLRRTVDAPSNRKRR